MLRGERPVESNDAERVVGIYCQGQTQREEAVARVAGLEVRRALAAVVDDPW